MKLIHVYGDDYAALTIEDEIGIEKAYQLAMKNGGSTVIRDYFNVDILEFDKVDLKFVDFVKEHLLDYDTSKHNNIYIIE